MSVTNGLCTLIDLRSALYNGTTQGLDDDGKLERAIESASRKIETWCGRVFTADTSASTRVFVADSGDEVSVDDISSTSGLVVKVDTAMDGTFTTTISAGYQLEPLNGRRNGIAWPYTEICLVNNATAWFPIYGEQALVQITAKWGWPGIPAPIRDACIIQAAAVLKGPESPFGVAGLGDMGIMRVKTGLHPQAEMLVADYRRLAVVA